MHGCSSSIPLLIDSFETLHHLNPWRGHAGTSCQPLLILVLLIVLSNFRYSICLHRRAVESNPTGCTIIRYVMMLQLLRALLFVFEVAPSLLFPVALLQACDHGLGTVAVLCHHHYMLNSVMRDYFGGTRPRTLRGEELGGADVHYSRDHIVVADCRIRFLFVVGRKSLISQIFLDW